MQPQSIAHAINNFCEMTCNYQAEKRGVHVHPPAYGPDQTHIHSLTCTHTHVRHTLKELFLHVHTDSTASLIYSYVYIQQQYDCEEELQTIFPSAFTYQSQEQQTVSCTFLYIVQIRTDIRLDIWWTKGEPTTTMLRLPPVVRPSFMSNMYGTLKADFPDSVGSQKNSRSILPLRHLLRLELYPMHFNAQDKAALKSLKVAIFFQG